MSQVERNARSKQKKKECNVIVKRGPKPINGSMYLD